MERQWEQSIREQTPGRWALIYASMNSEGEIMINRYCHDRLGSPEAVIILFDRLNHTIGLQPAKRAMRNAYPFQVRGASGGKVIRAHRMMLEFGIQLPGPVRFRDPEIDRDGILVLDLRKTYSVARAGRR